MPNYNSAISRSDANALIPIEYTHQILKEVPAASICLPRMRRLPNMSAAQRSIPVLNSLPTAYFISPGASNTTTLKSTTKMDWTNINLYAEELAVIVPIPEAVLEDANYDIWGEIKPYLVEAFGIAIDNAILYGTDAPSTWPTGIHAQIVAAGSTVTLGTGADLYDDILGESGVISLLEADGYMNTGNVACTGMKAKLRGVRDANGQPIFARSMQNVGAYELDGVMCDFPTNGVMNSATAWMYSGQWSTAVYAMRQDITYKVLDQAIIQDAAGNIVYNLAQQDMVALRCVMRLGWQLPKAVSRIASAATRCPFAALIP